MNISSTKNTAPKSTPNHTPFSFQPSSPTPEEMELLVLRLASNRLAVAVARAPSVKEPRRSVPMAMLSPMPMTSISARAPSALCSSAMILTYWMSW